MNSLKDWKYVCFLICVFAMVREIRPIEPFFTSYLGSLHFSYNQINEQIYVLGTYSCFIFSVVIFLTTDYFRYKPLIIADGIAGIFTYALLLGTPSLIRVQIEQIFFGFFYSSEVAFSTYLFAKIENKLYYQKITSLMKTSMLIGKFVSGLIAQSVVSTHLLNKIYLLYISIFSTSFVSIWALFLPNVEHSLYFHRNKIYIDNNKLQNQCNDIVITEYELDKNIFKKASIKEVIQIMLYDFKSAYSNIYVVKKCFWWIVAVIGHFVVETYIQVLWEDINGQNNDLMNGAVESIHTLCGASGAYVVGYIHYDWEKNGDIMFAIGTFILALLLFTIYYSNTLWILYVLYIIYSTFYQVLSTITTSEVAKHINPDSYGLIFGFNLFISLLVISIFTLLFIQGLVVVIGTKNQILTVSLMFVSMSVVFLIMAAKKSKKFIL